MKSVMSHNFATTPTVGINRSRFDMSFGHKTTMDSDWLVPMYWQAVLPGDTLNVNMTAFARLSTPLYPYMDNARFSTHYFFVPNRIIWDNFRKFCGEQVDPGDSVDYTIPVLEGAVISDGTKMSSPATDAERTGALMNYLGVPYGVAPDDVEMSALPWRAYSFIYSEWYRDQNLIDTPDCSKIKDDGPDDLDLAAEMHMLQRRGKRHDYFTSCLPWPQKDLDTVTIPLGSQAPVKGIGTNNQLFTSSTISVFESDGTNPTYAIANNASSGASNPVYIEGDAATGGYPQIYADLTNATASTINELREAFQIQKLLERDARAGSRYPEIVQNHFQVNFFDQSYRPTYLGGGSSPINITPIATTTENLPGASYNKYVGDLGAMGTATANRIGFNKSFNEHGIVMAICSITADLTYSQGVNRHLLHQTRYDYFWPTLAHLGEQSVTNKEIWVSKSAVDDDVFGYIPRYDEYRFNPSRLSGLFQPDAPSSLSAWHLSQDFATLPTLGQTFIESNTPFSRVSAVTTEPHFIVDTYFDIKAARPIPVNGVPGMIDHF